MRIFYKRGIGFQFHIILAIPVRRNCYQIFINIMVHAAMYKNKQFYVVDGTDNLQFFTTIPFLLLSLLLLLLGLGLCRKGFKVGNHKWPWEGRKIFVSR